VGHRVGPDDLAGDPQVGHVVAVVDVEHRPAGHRVGQVERPAAVADETGVQGEQPAVVVDTDPVGAEERVPLAGHRHVLAPVEPDADRPAGQRGREGGDGRERVALRLLAAEAAPHPQARDDDLAAREAEHLGHHALGLARVLRGHGARDVALGVHVRPGGVGLQVEVVLRAGPDLALEQVGRPVQGIVGIAAQDLLGLGVDAPGGQRGVDAEHRGQRLVRDDEGGRAQPGGLVGLADDPPDGVADVVHLGGREQLLVGGVPGAVVEPRDVVGLQHADHAGDRHRAVTSTETIRARACGDRTGRQVSWPAGGSWSSV
jgi:hypothetical protein